jgi:hypothetical protein
MNEELSDLSYEEFVRARQRHWQQQVKRNSPDAVLPELERTSLGEDVSNFMLYARGPEGFFAVFEDSDDTGWFYLYGVKERAILKCTHIYNRANVAVEADVVDIGWAIDGSACGLAVWGEFRAFLGVSGDLEMRKPLMNAVEDGIYASDWPPGFERFLETKID